MSNNSNFFIVLIDDIITEVSINFSELTGYLSSDFLYKSLQEVFELMRINKSSTYKDIGDYYYLFTKEYNVKEVNIFYTFTEDGHKKTYFFKEKIYSNTGLSEPFIDELIQQNVTKVGIYSVPDLIILKANQGFLDILDEPYNVRENTLGKRMDEILTGFSGSNVNEVFSKIIETGESFYFNEFKYEGLKTGTKYFDANIIPIYVNGTIKYITETFTEVTERVKNRQIIENQAKIITNQNEILKNNLRIQEDFFLNISHELKTPLNVIFSTIQLIELYQNSNTLENHMYKFDKYIHIIKQNCYRQSKLVNNIVDLSKIESGFFKLNLINENIVNIIEDIIESICEYVKIKGLEIVFDTNVEELIIACDPINIERVILNLVSNAIKFSDEGNEIYVNLIEKEDYVEISVKDTGIGIDTEHMTAIFERFNQIDTSLSRNTEGTGLGLCIAKSIIDLHGGDMLLESTLGEGSTFTFKLPNKVLPISKEIIDDKRLKSKVETINIEFSDIYS